MTAALLAVLVVAASPVAASRIGQGYVGCLTEAALDEFISAAVNEDKRQMQALLGSVCVPIGGLEYSMVDQGFMVSQIRVYVGSDSVLLYTVAEAAR